MVLPDRYAAVTDRYKPLRDVALLTQGLAGEDSRENLLMENVTSCSHPTDTDKGFRITSGPLEILSGR